MDFDEQKKNLILCQECHEFILPFLKHVMVAFIYFMSINDILPVCRGFVIGQSSATVPVLQGMDKHMGQ